MVRVGIFKPGVGKIGGTETFLLEMMKRITDHEIILITDNTPVPKELRELGIEIVQLPMIDRFCLFKEWFEIESLTLYASSRFTRTLDETDVDVWSTHYWLENLLVSRKVEQPSVFRFPGIKSPHIEWKIMKRLAEPEVNIANSMETKRRAKKWLGIECDEIVKEGVDCEVFNSDIEPAFNNDKFNILYVGRVSSGKGLWELIEAFELLSEKREEVKLWLVGEGSMEEKLKNLVKVKKISDEVEFVGRIDHNELGKWYVAADVFCLPSHHESFGIVNLEAMSCGTPVVASNLSVFREIIDEGVEGVFHEVGNYEDLFKKLDYLIENRAKREKMSTAGRKKAKKFGWDRQAEKMSKIYEKAQKDGS